MTIFLHFLLFYRTMTAHVVRILPCGRQNTCILIPHICIYSQYHGCLWSGDARSQGMSSQGIYLVDTWKMSYDLSNITCLIYKGARIQHHSIYHRLYIQSGENSCFPYRLLARKCLCMMTSSNGNSFRVTGLLCGWIPHTMASGAELWCFLWSVLN